MDRLDRFDQIAVIGPGLLGGSLLLAGRKYLPGSHLRVWARRSEALAEIKSRGIADFFSTDLPEVVEGADLIIFALPIQYMAELADRFPSLKKGTVVTDVGSTKESVVAELSGVIAKKGGVFIGCHPMAGSEKTGLEFADEDLFVEAPVILTPDEDIEGELLEKLKNFWNVLGGKLTLLGPKEHDRMVAAISHLPHLTAAALVRSVFHDRDTAAGDVGGIRDFGTPPELHREIPKCGAKSCWQTAMLFSGNWI